MKKLGTGGLACELEGIVAEEFGGFANRKLYVIEGRAGIYRRLTAAAGKETPDAMPAIYDGKLIHLQRQTAIEDELSQAGYTHREETYAKIVGMGQQGWASATSALPPVKLDIDGSGRTSDPVPDKLVDEGDADLAGWTPDAGNCDEAVASVVVTEDDGDF